MPEIRTQVVGTRWSRRCGLRPIAIEVGVTFGAAMLAAMLSILAVFGETVCEASRCWEIWCRTLDAKVERS